MKKSDMVWAGVCLVMISLSACANDDAAMLGSVVGRGLGRPLGGVAVAVEETFDTAEDVQDANPRYKGQSRLEQRDARPRRSYAQGRESSRRRPRDSDLHVYRTEVLIETRGPADIESLEIADAEEVTEFWR